MNQNNNYYELLPYKIENNNISFIISYNKDINNLFFYYYNFSINDEINKPKEFKFDNINIQNKNISCQIISYLSFIKCFYYSKIQSAIHLYYIKFSIYNNIIEKKQSKETFIGEDIRQVKTAKSYNNIFICYSKEARPICMINNLNDEIITINCQLTNDYSIHYKLFYFNETNEFMLISKTYLTTTLYNDISGSLQKCGEDIFSRQNKNYYIIYNNGYQLINYNNYKDYTKCHDISMMNEEDNKITYIPKETSSEILASNEIYLKEVISISKEEIFYNISSI